MTDYSEYLIKLRALTKQAEDQLNQGKIEEAFDTSVEIIDTGLMLQDWCFGNFSDKI